MVSSRAVAWIMWGIASLFYAYQYILRVIPNIMLNDIMNQFQIDAAAFGQFSGVYYIGYSLMHIPLGLLLDRYGPKKILTGCIGMTIVGLLPILFTHHWIYPMIGRVLIGMGSSAAILGTFKIVRMVFHEKHFTRMLSFAVTIGLIGAIYGGGPVHYLCRIGGYQWAIQIFVGMGVLLALTTYCIIPAMKPQPSRPVLRDLKEVFGNPRVIWVCLSAGLMVGPLEGFADVWGTEFLKQVYGLESSTAAKLPSFIFIGMCFGAPILSLIAEKTNSYVGTIIGAGLGMALSFYLLIFGKLSLTIIGLLFGMVGVCCAYQIIAIYKASTYGREQVAGLTTAVVNMIIMTFGYVFHTVMGVVIHRMGGTHSTEAFIYGILIIPIALSIGTVGFTALAFYDRNAKTIL
jgi:predicted MFS family arabinose efflux permease